jgi:hypothetical protein
VRGGMNDSTAGERRRGGIVHAGSAGRGTPDARPTQGSASPGPCSRLRIFTAILASTKGLGDRDLCVVV